MAISKSDQQCRRKAIRSKIIWYCLQVVFMTIILGYVLGMLAAWAQWRFFSNSRPAHPGFLDNTGARMAFGLTVLVVFVLLAIHRWVRRYRKEVRYIRKNW